MVSSVHPSVFKNALAQYARSAGVDPARLKLRDAVEAVPQLQQCPPKLLADLRIQLITESKRPAGAQSPVFAQHLRWTPAAQLGMGPITEMAARGDAVSARINGQAVSGTLLGYDYAGRPVIGTSGGRRRVAEWEKSEVLGGKRKSGAQAIVGLDATTLSEPPAGLAIGLKASLGLEVCGKHRVREYVDALCDRGYTVMLVGGALRDALSLLEKNPQASGEEIAAALKDVDIVCTAPVPVLREVAHEVGADLPNAGIHSPAVVDQFGVCLVGGPKAGLSNKEGLDLASLRSQGAGDPQAENPDTGETVVPYVFDHNLEEDAWARDFTCNSVYAVYDAKTKSFKLADPTGHGIADARAGFLRFNRAFLLKQEMHSLRFFKFRMRGFESDATNVALAKNHMAHHFPRLGASQLTNSVLKIAPKDASTRDGLERFLRELRETMAKDGCAQYFDEFIAPLRERMWSKLSWRTGKR